jgi:hypothetical protein
VPVDPRVELALPLLDGRRLKERYGDTFWDRSDGHLYVTADVRHRLVELNVPRII